MAFCTHCGSELPADARFCAACGRPVDASPASEPAAQPATVTPAPADPHPGATAVSIPQVVRRSGGGGGGLILPIIIVVALFVIGATLWTQRDGARPIAGVDRTETRPTGEKAVTAGTGDERVAIVAPDAGTADDANDPNTTLTTVASLDAAFRSDPQGARARYAGRVTASGTVAAVTLGGTPSLSLEGRTPFNYVVANVADASQIADATKGDRVTLTCDRVTALAGTTILQGCVRN